MFVKTVKVKKTAQVLGYILMALLLVFVAVFLFNRFYGGSKSITLDSEAAQLDFLHELGWETSECAIDVRSVIVPEEWNDVYNQYNDLQLEQGLDLSDYKGCAVEIYTYEIYNYADEDNVVVNLMICDGKLIAGDVCCTELGGFMQGLVREGTAAETL